VEQVEQYEGTSVIPEPACAEFQAWRMLDADWPAVAPPIAAPAALDVFFSSRAGSTERMFLPRAGLSTVIVTIMIFAP
jgi:hypothetical protein